MKDIILPITCYQCNFIIYGLLVFSSLLSLLFYSGNMYLFTYGLISGSYSIIFGIVIVIIFIVDAYEDGKFPHFPLRCKCDKK